MKKYIWHIIFAITILLVIAAVITASIADVLKNGFRSYGAIVLAAILLITLLGVIALFIKRLFPKSKAGKFIRDLDQELTEGLFNILSFAGA